MYNVFLYTYDRLTVGEVNKMTKEKENQELRILSAIGIILVVAGHLGYNLFDWGGLFPYYSFHVFIFLFVSGYFYKDEVQEHILQYIIKKCKTLLLPYFVWNLFYGILATVLHKAGFYIGQELSLYTMFVAPFENGHHFMYHFPAWFVPVLFVIEVVNVCMRKVLTLMRMNKEWLILTGCLLAGVATVYLAMGGHVWGYYKIPGRILFMLPGFQMGCFYRKYLEKHDTLPDKVYFPIVIGIQLLISFVCAGLAFSAVWVTSFANGPVVPYVTVITGIALWLRIAKIAAKLPEVAKPLIYLGRNTYAIMMHHMFSFFLLNCVFFALYLCLPGFYEFNTELFFADINYTYLPRGDIGKWLYMIVGIGGPLLIGVQAKRVSICLWDWYNNLKRAVGSQAVGSQKKRIDTSKSM